VLFDNLCILMIFSDISIACSMTLIVNQFISSTWKKQDL